MNIFNPVTLSAQAEKHDTLTGGEGLRKVGVLHQQQTDLLQLIGLGLVLIPVGVLPVG